MTASPLPRRAPPEPLPALGAAREGRLTRCGVGLQLRTVRTKTHKCTFELGSGAGELYDLVNDPAEMHNRFDDPAYRIVRNQLEALMRARPGSVRENFAEPIGMA